MLACHKQLSIPGSCAYSATVFTCLVSVQQPAQASCSDNAVLAEANRLASKRAYAEADKLYRRVIVETPDNSTAHHLYGRVLALQGNYEGALQQYKQSLRFSPKDSEIYNDIGVVLSISGRTELGGKFLHRALEFNGRFASALNNLGVVLDKLGAYRQASEVLLIALENQRLNNKIVELKAKVDAKLADSKTFDFGPPVSWQDVPESLKPAEPAEIPAIAVPQPVVAITPTVEPAPPKTEVANTNDKQWLAEATPLFLDLKSSGFAKVAVYGTGLVQVGNVSDSADALGEVDLSSGKVEISGEVVFDLNGKGELQVGNYKVQAKNDNCVFSINGENGALTCYAGDFAAANWSTIEATRGNGKVTIDADHCRYVYAQDDSEVGARDCDQVTLVGHAQGTIDRCGVVVLNDRSRAIARSCKKLTVMAHARARAWECEEVKELDHAKVEAGE